MTTDPTRAALSALANVMPYTVTATDTVEPADSQHDDLMAALDEWNIHSRGDLLRVLTHAHIDRRVIDLRSDTPPATEERCGWRNDAGVRCPLVAEDHSRHGHPFTPRRTGEGER